MKRLSGFFLSFNRQELALVGVTMLWGGTFLIIHTAMKHSGPFFFVGLRFLVATVLLVIVFRKTLRGLTWRELGAGSVIGLFIFFTYGLQTYGLQTISSSQSAFITALYVPVVPLLQWLFWRRPPGLASWLGVLLAFTGLVLIANPEKGGSFVFSAGEGATLLGAFAAAIEIILIGHFAASVDSRRVTVVQVAVAALASFLAMPVMGEGLPEFSWIWGGAALILGVMSALIQSVMNWAQKSVSPTRATIIYAGEPVWAGIIGRLAGDRLPAIALLGAAFILAGILVAELKLTWRKRTSR